MGYWQLYQNTNKHQLKINTVITLLPVMETFMYQRTSWGELFSHQTLVELFVPLRSHWIGDGGWSLKNPAPN